MSLLLLSPGDRLPDSRLQSRIRGFARFQAFVIALVAFLGTAMPGFAQTHLSSLTGINGPTFVTVDSAHPAGTTWLYVSEHGGVDETGTGGGRILKYNLTTGQTVPTVIAMAGSLDGQFRSPDAILIDAATGDLFISDRYMNRVQRITSTGTFVMKWGSSTALAADEMHGPVGMTRDAAGAIYVAEHGDANGADVVGNVVSKYTLNGIAAPTRVWRISHSLNVPYGVAVSGSSLLVSDGFAQRIQIWDLDGGFTGLFALPGIIPLGLKIDSTGALWIAESSGTGVNAGHGTIQQIDKRTAAGVSLGFTFGTVGAGTGQLELPFDIAIDEATNLGYVADYHNNRVAVWDLTSTADVTAPTVTSLTFASVTATSATYTLTFNEAVTGVNAGIGGDFTLVGSSGVIGTVGAASPSSGSALVWTIPITYSGPAGGTLRLNLNTASHGIADVATNALSGGATGDEITIPGSGPSVTAFAYLANTLTFRITFNEAVTGVDTADFEIEPTGGNGASIASVTSEIDDTAASRTITFNFTFGGPGSIQLRIKPTGTGITGASGPFTGSGLNNAHVPVGVLGETVPPTVTSFTPGPAVGFTTIFTLLFDESVLGFNAADVTIAPASTLGSPTIGTITTADATGARYSIPVTFSGTGSLQLIVRGGAPGAIEDSQHNLLAADVTSDAFIVVVGGVPEINVTGNAVAIVTGDATPSLTDSTDFGSMDVTTGTVSKTYTVLNTGTAALTVGTVTVGGANAADFTVTTQPGASVAASGSTTFIVEFNPSAVGPRNASLSFTNNDADENPFTFGILGTGTVAVPEINVTGNAVAIVTGDVTPSLTDSTDFGSMDVTTGTVSKTYTVLNTGTAALTVGTVTVGGANAADFSVTTQPDASVAASGSTTFTVEFNPSATGPRNASLAFANNDADENPFTFNIQGTGTTLVLAPEINVTGNAVAIVSGDATPSTTDSTDFGSLDVTTGTVSKTYTIQNTGNAALTVGTVLISGGAAADFSVTTQPAASVAASGSTTFVVLFDPSALGARPATLTFANSDADENPFTFDIQGTGITLPAPVVTAGSISGTVGTAITPFQVVASNSPTSYSAAALAPFGLSISSSGVISGTPTAIASSVAITVTATNGTGPGTGTITLGIVAAPPTPPVVTVTFGSVTGAIVNQPFTLSATASSGATVTFSLVSGNATLIGSVLTPGDTSAITVRATASGSGAVATAVISAKNTQTISFPALNDVGVGAVPMTLGATSTSGLAVTYTVAGPATINGSSLAPTGVAGTVTVRANQAGNATFNAAAEVVRSFTVSAGQQVFIGTMGPDTFGLAVSADRTEGMFIIRIAATGEAIVVRFALTANGTFNATGTSSLAAGSGGLVLDPTTPSIAAAVLPRTIVGQVSNGVVTGSITELGTSFTAPAALSTGPTASLAGFYTASAPGSSAGETYIIVGPNGQAFGMAVTPNGVTSGTGTVSPGGTFTIATSGGGSITGNVNASTGVVAGTVTVAGATTSFVGLSEGTETTARLINVSSRLRVVAGDSSRTVVAGFYVSGTVPKRVLVRAVGPGLAAYGITDGLANPKLQLFAGATMIAENDDWSNSADISATGASVGAFQLAADSRDSALTATLAAGSYTAIVTGIGGNGVVLIEVYDAGSNTSLAAQQLINISTRGFVEAGEGNLTAGFVVTGNSPKQVLIRGIGPSLAQYGVTGTVADPSLKLYALGNSAPIAQNDDWGLPQAVNATQATASAADISLAAAATGAFALPAGSKDAAIVITLMPGQYSAVVSGAGGSTGAGMVEVYGISGQ